MNYSHLKEEILEVEKIIDEEYQMGFKSGELSNGFYFNSGRANGYHEADIFETIEELEKGQPNDSVLLCSYFDYLYELYSQKLGEDLGQVEWELLEKLSKKNENTSKEQSIQLFEMNFIEVSELNTIY